MLGREDHFSTKYVQCSYGSALGLHGVEGGRTTVNWDGGMVVAGMVGRGKRRRQGTSPGYHGDILMAPAVSSFRLHFKEHFRFVITPQACFSGEFGEHSGVD